MRNTTLTGIPTTYVYNNTTYEVGYNGTMAYWNEPDTLKSTNYNDWTTAGLQYYLNTEKDNSATPVAGYLSTVSSTSKNLIRETTYYLGNVETGVDTILTAYNNERDENKKWDGNQPTWDGKIGLLYPSDVGYSALSSYWSGTKLYEYSGSAVKASNWMQQTHSMYEWLLSPSSNGSRDALCWYSAGYLNNRIISNNNSHTVRPVLNLKSQTEILIGDGTSNLPYVVILS